MENKHRIQDLFFQNVDLLSSEKYEDYICLFEGYKFIDIFSISDKKTMDSLILSLITSTQHLGFYNKSKELVNLFILNLQFDKLNNINRQNLYQVFYNPDISFFKKYILYYAIFKGDLTVENSFTQDLKTFERSIGIYSSFFLIYLFSTRIFDINFFSSFIDFVYIFFTAVILNMYSFRKLLIGKLFNTIFFKKIIFNVDIDQYILDK